MRALHEPRGAVVADRVHVFEDFSEVSFAEGGGWVRFQEVIELVGEHGGIFDGTIATLPADGVELSY